MSENRLFCDVCIGKKYVIGMGMIHADCPKCKGKGYVDDSDKSTVKIDITPIVDDISDSLNIDPSIVEELKNVPHIIKKKGRPKKNTV